MVSGWGFEIYGSGFMVCGLGLKIMVQGLGLRVEGLGVNQSNLRVHVPEKVLHQLEVERAVQREIRPRDEHCVGNSREDRHLHSGTRSFIVIMTPP